MKDKKMEQLKKAYKEIPIPQELDSVVRNALKESGIDNRKKRSSHRTAKYTSAAIAAALLLTVAGANTSQAFAQTMAKVPVIGSIVKVLTFREYTLKAENYDADIKVPQIQGLENKELENSLNQKYLSENKNLYEDFNKEIEQLKKASGGHLGVSTGYKVVTDNDTIFSIVRYELKVAGSSDTKLKYDTIDKKNQVMITLPSLFKNDSYVDVISKNIIAQMKEQMKGSDGKIYFIKGMQDIVDEGAFEKISNNQSFYINSNGKLVISFNKYECAPGFMGTPEFVIPTEAIKDILQGDGYIK